MIRLLPPALALGALLACTPDTVPWTPPERGAGGTVPGWGGSAPDPGEGGSGPAVCVPGDRRWCRRADTTDAQRSVGACLDGSQLCADGTGWSDCGGGVGPTPEPAACDGIDQDCDGRVDDEEACEGPPADEVCGNAVDDDGDGAIDDPELCNLTCTGAQVGGPMDCCFQDEPGPPCDRLGCEGRANQPCYGGPPGTLGVGICRGGRTSCEDGGRWGACEGQTLPQVELCGDALDGDCDGVIDEADGATGRRCPPTCVPDVERCNGIDDDCDGFVDEACPAQGTQACHAGPRGTRGVGACRDGTQVAVDGWWSLCDSVGPAPELCFDGIDGDCNGRGGPGEPEDLGCDPEPSAETCNGEDDDGDGEIDEGLPVNECGSCDEACYWLEITEPASCLEGNGRICDRIVPDENRVDWFTISTDRRGGAVSNVLYGSVTDTGEIVKVDTITGVRVWRVPAQVDLPRYIAVPLDNSVWIGGDGVAHLDRDGNLVCRVELVSAGLAIDDWGDVLTITPEGVLHKISGTAVKSSKEGEPPACERFDLALDLGVAADGIVTTARDVLWTGSTPTVRVHLGTLRSERVDHLPSTDIAASSSGAPWFGGDTVHVLSPEGPYEDPASYQTSITAPATGLSVAEDDAIWGIDAGTTLVRIDPVTLAPSSYELPGESRTTAPDDAGKVWALGTSGLLHRFDPINLTWDTFAIAPGEALDAVGDFTGSDVRQFVARSGSWIQLLEADPPGSRWRRLRWKALVPVGTRVEELVEVSASFAPTRDALLTAPRCGPFTSSPADLSACPGHRGPWMAIFIALSSTRDGRKPTVGDIAVSWTRR